MGKSTWTIVVVVLIIVAGICIVKYNGLSMVDEQVTKSWTPLGGELKKRYASLPRLVPEVNLYVGAKLTEATALSAAMAKFTGAGTFAEQVEAANGVETAVQQLAQVLAERFPVISGQHQFDVIRQIAQGTGAAMAPMVAAYNKAVDDYNSYSRRFPANLVAAVFGFPAGYEYFQEEK